MNWSLINIKLLNENLTYRTREPFKRKGIRWLALNGGIRWVILNEREKAVNEGGGKEDKRRKKTFERGDFLLWGERALFFILETILGIFIFGRLADCITGFWLEKLVVGMRQGAPVVGSFGLEGQESLRNPRARELERLYS
jgi:hypothetical protein